MFVDSKAQALLDAGYLDQLAVLGESHQEYWEKILLDYPNHPLANQQDQWPVSIGCTLYGPLAFAERRSSEPNNGLRRGTL